jgi:hypothetical protein
MGLARAESDTTKLPMVMESRSWQASSAASEIQPSLNEEVSARLATTYFWIYRSSNLSVSNKQCESDQYESGSALDSVFDVVAADCMSLQAIRPDVKS